MLHERKASEIATGRWVGVLQALGIDNAFLRNKHGPCPMCGGKDRFRFDDKGGRGTWICNQCGPGDGYKLLQEFHGWRFVQAVREVESVVGAVQIVQVKQETEEAKKVAAIKRVVGESESVVVGDPVWKYLNRRVGIEIVPASLRYHPALAYVDDEGEITHHPAMIAIVTGPDGKGASVHRTYLTADGRKADVASAKKLMPGRPLQGAAIRLGSHADTLGIAEGIETALAASRRFEVPVWACVSSSLMEGWKQPVGVKRVMVFGDNDEKFGGQAAAYRVAYRLAGYGVSVEVHIPERVGSDWADEAQA